MLANLWKPVRSLVTSISQTTKLRLFSNGPCSMNSWRHFKYHSDLEFRRRHLDRCIVYYKKRKLVDPEYHKKMKAQNKKLVSQARSNEDYRRRETMLEWIRRSKWAQTDLPWKSYRPVIYSERIAHLCTGCNVQDYRTKLWWSSTSESAKYLCSPCWSKLGWDQMCPDSFENATSWKEFTACAKELGTAKP